MISSLDALRQVVGEERYSGRLTFRATITDTGFLRNAVVISPASLKESKKLRSSIEALKFCPAVRHSRYSSETVNFNIAVE